MFIKYQLPCDEGTMISSVFQIKKQRFMDVGCWEFAVGCPGGSAGKESACNVGDMGLIPGLGRSPGEGNGYPLHCPGLENSTDTVVHGVAKSQTQLNDFHFLSFQWLGGQGSIPGVGLGTGRGERGSTTKMPYPTCCVVQPKQTSK